MEENEEVLREHINEQLQRPSTAEYGYIKVLLLFWAGSTPEHVSFQEEGRRLGKFFSDKFNFPVAEFAIPSVLPQLQLTERITSEIVVASKEVQARRDPSLLIIHYGGHGDEDDEERRAVWAGPSIPQEEATAQEEEPLILWYKIQETLEDSKADILLLLDCCFSARAGRARKKSSRIEMLTASAKRETTPLPGEKSFTSALIKVMNESVEANGCVTITETHAQLLKRDTDLYGTSVHITLRPGKPDRSIRLFPVGMIDNDHSNQEVSGPCIRLLIRTPDLTAENVDELILWLRSDLPTTFSLEVESIVKKAAIIQDFIKTIPQGNKPLTRSLDGHTIEGLVNSWAVTSDLVAQYKSKRDALVASAQGCESLRERSHDFVEQLKSQNSNIIDATEQGVLQSLDSHDNANLTEIIKDPYAGSLGILDQLRLRRMVFQPNAFSPDNLRNEKPVPVTSWKESKEYGRYLNPIDIPAVEESVSQIARLLNASKSPSFRALKCINWYHESLEHEFVLEFDLPDIYKSKTGSYKAASLSKVVARISGPQRPTLGQRFRIALSIAKAVRQWHAVGWVHQSINAHNVIFFARSGSGLDYENPFLQGFDFSRPNQAPSLLRYVDNVETNVYRHPDRQGPARIGHKRLHDLYSLGVVLLEVGLWENAYDTSGVRKGKETTVDQMKDNLVKAATTRLAHYAGIDYQEAVLACLESNFGVQVDNEAGSNLARQFQEKVINKLENGSHLG